MNDAQRIRKAFERNRRALTLRPAMGQGTAVTRARMVDGLTCEVSEGDWNFKVDIGEKAGGNNQGPNPGVFGRGALATCLAITYLRWAAFKEVPVDALEVEVQADYDSRGEMGLDSDITPAYSEVRYLVAIESSAPESVVRQMVDEADEICSYLKVFAEPMRVTRTVQIQSPGSNSNH